MAMTQTAARGARLGKAGDAALFATAGWPLIVFIWAAFSLASAIQAFPGVLDALSTDDAMRLVEVRDLLSGQAWTDMVQHRLNPPTGVLMHWSRVIDLPIALMLSGFGLVFSEDVATRLTITIWPALLFLPALLAAASASRTLAGPSAGVIGAFMMVMSPGVASHFAPAAIDHHGAQIALALILLACALKLDRFLWAGVGAGAAAAVMTAIGIETAPHVAVAAGLIALRWAVRGGEGMARGAGAFGLSFALVTLALAATTLSPETALSPVCDAFGLPFVVVAGIGGLGLFVATRLKSDNATLRFLSLAQIGAGVGAAVLMAAPNCLGSPLANLPDRMKTGWLDNVQEAQPFFVSLAEQPTSGFASGAPLIVLMLVAAWALWAAPKDRRWQIGTAVAMCGVAFAVTLWQVRGSSLAYALGGPLLPLAVLAIGRTGAGSIRTALAAIALCPAAIALSVLAVMDLGGMPSATSEAPQMCRTRDYIALLGLPAGLALNTIDSGPFILAFSPLSAVAAPYHRNVDGILAGLDAFGGTEATARAIAVSRGADYVVLCAPKTAAAPASSEPATFSQALIAGRTPSWLEPIDLGPDAGVKAYRVKLDMRGG